MTDLGLAFLALGIGGGLAVLGACLRDAAKERRLGTVSAGEAFAAGCARISEAIRWRAKVEAGLIVRKREPLPPPDPTIQRLEAYLATRALQPETEDDIRGLYAIVLGHRQGVMPDAKARLIRMGIPLPDALPS